jgi:membrane protein DedA with SNARE-associated domain
VFSFVGALGWNSLLIGMGAALGTQHELLEQYLAYLDYVVYSALGLAVAVLVIRRLREAARTRRLARAELQD